MGSEMCIRDRSIYSDSSPIGLIPDLTIVATDKVDSTITVIGKVDDFITSGDPIAFTHMGVRHYYRACEDLRLDGTEQQLKVYIKPRFTLTGLSILAERVRPTCRFLINTNAVVGVTTSDNVSTYQINGV